MSPRVLYVAMEFDYGDPRRGESFEHANFHASLVGMGCDLTHFDFMERTRQVGKEAMRRELLAVAGSGDYDLVFFFLFTDQIDGSTIRECGRIAGAPTLNWFADDHWRFDGFTRRIAPFLDWSVTTDPDSLEKYERAGLDRVLLSQWACNRYLYVPTADAIGHGVTFIGQPHADRARVIGRLAASGIPVECWGTGWPNGRLGTAEMIHTFGTSAVNLNLANSSHPRSLRGLVLRAFGRGGTRPKQIKGRTFEIPGCGGFQLADRVPHLGSYFLEGEEIAVFDSTDDLIEQARYWLGHPEERQRIADAGYARVVREHTYDHRFREIFGRIGVDIL